MSRRRQSHCRRRLRRTSHDGASRGGARRPPSPNRRGGVVPSSGSPPSPTAGYRDRPPPPRSLGARSCHRDPSTASLRHRRPPGTSRGATGRASVSPPPPSSSPFELPSFEESCRRLPPPDLPTSSSLSVSCRVVCVLGRCPLNSTLTQPRISRTARKKQRADRRPFGRPDRRRRKSQPFHCFT